MKRSQAATCFPQSRNLGIVSGMQRLSWLIAPPFDSVTFALRLCLAEALALYLSMWLQLDRPYWASLEVAVMIQPMPGMAVVRGFARASGTLVAGAAGLLIVALFQQSYELSAAALAIWITFCAFGSNLLRNNLSYGFAIAGFIAGIGVILSHTLTLPPFDIIVARVSECVLAAIVTAAVNVLFTSPKAARAYRASRIALLAAIGQEYGRLASLGGDAATPIESGRPEADSDDEARCDPHVVLEGLAEQALALEQHRQYVSYELPGFSHFSRMARRLDYDILALISAASSLHIYLDNRRADVDTAPLGELAEPARRMAENPNDWQAIGQAFDTAYAAILNQARAPGSQGGARRLADWVVLSRTLNLASRGRAAMIKHGMLLEERVNDVEDTTRRSEFGQPIDLKNALRNALRTLTAVGIGGIVWVNFHDQLPAVLLMILLGALTTIFASVPNPVAAAGGFAKGLLMAAAAAFVVDFFILPSASSYAMLMLAMLPVYFVAGLAMTEPSLALPGRISAVMFSLLVHVQNGTLQTFTIYIQIVIGILSAVTLTAIAFRVVLPVAPRQRLREQMFGVFKELATGRRYSRECFETRMYDRLNNLVLTEIVEGPLTFSAQRAVLAAINIGLEVRSLLVMTERMNLPDHLAQKLASERAALRDLFAGRRPASIDDAAIRARAIHAWAEHMLAYAVARDNEAERRLAIRASICAELVASALMDYVGAFERRDDPPGEPAGTTASTS
ncbi:MAG: FUSC family protein [Salinisphaera sp.]|jgi:uncharacterized membrane protein YccC|nr:FUSC family protein [Salinisphaera sp.]